MRKWILPAAAAAVIVAVGVSVGRRPADVGQSSDATRWAGPTAEALARALRGDRSITGRVVDADGRPVAKATVEAIGADPAGTLAASPCPCRDAAPNLLQQCSCEPAAARLAVLLRTRTGEPPVIARTTSDAEGRFVLVGLAEATFHLWASDGGTATIAEAVAAGTDAELTLATAHPLRGRAEAASGEGLAGVSIFAVHRRHGRVFESASAADGAFAFAPLPAGEYLLVAARDDLIARTEPVRLPEGEELKVELWPRKRLDGIVLRGDAPAAEAHVVAEQGSWRHEARSGRDGAFSIDGLSDGEWSLVATLGEEVALGVVELATESHSGRVRLALGFGVAVAGSVRDGAGRPVPDATVEFRSAPDRNDDHEGVARASSSGRFLTRPLIPGTYAFRATAPRSAPSEWTELNVAEAGATVELRLRDEAEATGQVTDAEGRPLADVKISLAHDPYVAHEQGGEARSDQDGGFSITSLPAGRYRLVAARDGYRATRLEVSLPAPRLQVVLERRKLATGRVAGRVVGGGDRPIEGAAVRVGEREGVTDRFGRFEIDEVGDGTQQVSATAGDDSVRSEVLVAGGTAPELLLRLGGGLSIRGRVTDSRNRPQPAVGITARPLRDRSTRSEGQPREHSTESRSDGSFEVGGLAPGAYELSYSRSWQLPGGGLGGIGVYGGSSTHARAGDENVRIEVAGLFLIAGRVLGDRGEPVPEFEIDGQPIADPGGRFEHLLHSEEPEPRFTVTAPGYAPATTTVRLQDDGTTRIPDIVLSHGRTVAGRVVDGGDGSPVRGATLTLTSSSGSRLHAPSTLVTRSDGTFRLENVPSERLEITVEHPSYPERRVALGPEEATSTITLTPAAVLYGTVTTLDGRPLAGVELNVHGEDEREDGPDRYFMERRESRSDGRYEVTRMPPGRYSVDASHRSFSRILHDERIPEGSFDMQLVEVRAGERRRLDLVERSRGSTLKIAVLDGEGKASRAAFPLLALGVHSISEQPLSFVDLRRRLGRLVSSTPAAPGAPVEYLGLTPGPYTVVVWPREGGSAAAVVTRLVEITGDAPVQSVEIHLSTEASADAQGR
ncbi:MAG TPA: carboxypeptidase-like regulatory domain-containing protein [Anaeromyxobacteraceae bacterium]|nr:carboxypeptidase-like regulatory domain-containing protein [Anaeromyxobacteraceae bacterium]